jgi:serine/threonine-protein kinase
MAVVYLARDLKHERQVALKAIRADFTFPGAAERFTREIRLAARLQHPHILSVHDSGESAGQLWFTMPYVEGESLRDRLTRVGRLPVNDAVRITREAAQALEYAHQHSVIHRDIKPENILLTKDGSVLVADFGIARAIAGDTVTQTPGGTTQLTETGVAVGTPAYMAPEQRFGTQANAQSDVYSLAAVLYELLTGQAVSAMVPRVRSERPEVSTALEAIVQRGLNPDPSQRFPSMEEFATALDRPDGVSRASGTRKHRVGVALAVLALLLVAAGYYLRRSRGSSTADALPTSAAVLPFTDQSPETNQAYFADGLAEELTTTLARIPGLRVVARASAFQFRGTNVDPREVGRRLGVGAVLQGTVRRNGARLRVSAQLVNTRDGYELWSDIYDRDMADVFQVQEDIARAIGGALRVRLVSGVDSAIGRHPTADLQAYDLYLQGRFAWNQRTESSLPQAARYFAQAVARDSGFSRAWAGLADVYVLLPLYTPASPDTTWPRARAAALKAIALDSGSAEASAALAYGTMLYQWDMAGSERAFRQAIAADSSYPTAHHWYADFLVGRGRLQEGLAEMTRAHQLDPLSRIIGTEEAWIYCSMGRLNDADSAIARVLRLDPAYSQGLFILGQIRVEQKRYPEAIAALKRSLELGGEFMHGEATLIAAYARSGDRASARALLDSMTRRAAHEYIPPGIFAIAYANLGDLDRAFEFLERGIRERDAILPENFFEPLLNPLKADPRYPGVAARIRGE